jgi:hypothetical protein
MPRTFPELDILDPDSPFTRECSLPLKAYHTFAPDMGYVQGMSFVAATLLMHLPSYQAFDRRQLLRTIRNARHAPHAEGFLIELKP